ncbi:MAG TPA: SDR family oxidoreductase [Thermoplasmata archaeon]|nr:SDR family oxidoreductase [Thermoplasmata archaeon]
MTAKVALVTGCSSGIGYATAVALARRGYRVYATGRTRESLEPLLREAAAQRLAVEPVLLDLRDPASIEGAVTAMAAAGRLDVLVNNSGYGMVAALEDVRMEDVRELFEVNVFGTLHLTRRALPLLKASRGTVVMMSSVAGRISVPLMGAYCASKFALEALSDALRVEVRGFGVRVVVVEPGPVKTRFGQAVREHSRTYWADPASPYARAYATQGEWYDGGSGRFAMTADQIAATVVQACEKRSPRARYVRMVFGRLAIGAVGLFPRRWVDTAVARRFGLG